MFTPSIILLLASAGLIHARSVHEARSIRHSHGLLHQRVSADSTSLTLSADAIQIGSSNDGQSETGASAGQSPSLTSTNNFINNCAGKTLTNGLQITTGSCNGIPMGDIPAKSSMVSSMITFPLAGSATIESDVSFNITVQITNLVAGSFTNADATYYAAPQALSGGLVVGHTHVTVQDMGASLNPTTPLDATQFAFFRGINDAGNGKGLLTAPVTGGLPAGNYRVCTMTASSNHQPVLMPVAQRGSSDDCTKFTVIGNGKVGNIAANDGSKGLAASSLAAEAVSLGPDVNVSQTSGTVASTSEASTTTTAGKVDSTSFATSAPSTSTSKAGKGSGNTVSSAVKGNSGGSTTTTAISVISTTVVQKVTVIETFFEFTLSLGGLPPSVSKNGGNFLVLEQIFEDITLACGAACEEQFTQCTAIQGLGFSLEECTTQKESCGSAASSQSSSASPATITATVTVPATATVTGSILSETTISTTFTSTATQASAVATGAAVTNTATQSATVTTQTAVVQTLPTESECLAPVTSTIFVDPVPTQVAVVDASATTSCAPLATSTVVVDSSAAASSGSPTSSASSSTVTVVADSSALGGIAAPAITDSGDSTRPFEVNGNTFVNKSAAVQRSCDVQFNACANAFNSGKANGAFNLSDCQNQEDACITAGGS